MGDEVNGRHADLGRVTARIARIVALGAAALLAAVWANPAQAGDDGQLWTSAAANVKLGADWRLQQELTARLSNNRDGLYEIESVSLLGYRIAKDVTFAAGYVHNPQYAGGDFTLLERRAREQVTFDNVARIGTGKLGARMRLEQRWREGVDGTGWRMRPYVKFSIPVSTESKTSLVLSSETFVNLNSTAFQKQGGLDRMRNFIGINTPLTDRLSAEVGYLNQHDFVRGGEDSSDHAASVSLSLSL